MSRLACDAGQVPHGLDGALDHRDDAALLIRGRARVRVRVRVRVGVGVGF